MPACEHGKEMCAECEIDFLDACIERDMERIEQLKSQINKQKGEQDAVST